MSRFSALIAVVLAFLVVPALASAAPTTSTISVPASPAFVTYDHDHPTTLHVAGTTGGGPGNVDVRCYYGTKGPLLLSQVPVVNGAFSVDLAVTQSVIQQLGDNPEPYCMLRAVPTGTVPAAPPGQATPWQGAYVGWGQRYFNRVANGSDAVYDFFVSRAQSAALDDYNSIGSCGLCDTYLFAPGTKTPTNPIWWGDGALYPNPTGITTRTAVQIDGANAYTAYSADRTGANQHLADNPGFPAVSESDSVDPATGDLTINERAAYAWCAEDRSVYPPTDASCASFTDSGVHYERTIRQSDGGLQVTIVDRWKSVDGKAHTLDAIYQDSARSENSAIAGREGRQNFTWTQDGFATHLANTLIPLPASVPATMLVKTDGSTPDSGDNTNPIGAMVFGSTPSELRWTKPGDAVDKNAYWETRYQRTIPAGGEVSIAVGYAHDLTLTPVKSKAAALQTALTAPSVGIDSPADGSTIDAASAHVTGTAASVDGQATVTVNGVWAIVGSDGQWSADVPLSEGSNQIVAVASNRIGVTTTASVSVNRPAAPAAPAAATSVVAAKPIRCVVPRLRGKTLTTAKRLLKRAHCRLGKVVHKASTRVKPGRIVATRFKAGTRHPAGSRVRVTVATKARRR